MAAPEDVTAFMQGVAPEEVNTYMFPKEIRPIHRVQLFFEMKYSDEDVDNLLPPQILQNRTARKQASVASSFRTPWNTFYAPGFEIASEPE